MLGNNRSGFGMRTVEGIDIVSGVRCGCPSVSFVNEEVIQGGIVANSARQSYPHATDGNRCLLGLLRPTRHTADPIHISTHVTIAVTIAISIAGVLVNVGVANTPHPCK